MSNWEGAIVVAPFLAGFLLTYIASCFKEEERYFETSKGDIEQIPTKLRNVLLFYGLNVFSLGFMLLGVSTIPNILSSNSISDTNLVSMSDGTITLATYAAWIVIVLLMAFFVLTIVFRIKNAWQQKKEREENEYEYDY